MLSDTNPSISVGEAMPDVAFIIPARNEAHRIGLCLDAIAACRSDGLTTESIVIDNGSDDDTVDVARAYHARVLERPGESISALRNIGVASTQAPLIAFIDADVLVADDWLTNATREIARENVVMVGASPGIPEDSSWVTKTWHLQISARAAYGNRDWLASMNVMVRRKEFLAIGGFDESLETCEDVDLGYRLSQHHLIVSDRRIVATHLGEARTLSELFAKEAWRGRANYAGALQHGFQLGEMPSLVQPPLTLVGLLGLILSIPLESIALAVLSFACFAAFPIARSLMIARRSGAWKKLPQLTIVWAVYSLARVRSLAIESLRWFSR